MVAKWGFCLGLQFTLGCTCQVSLIKTLNIFTLLNSSLMYLIKVDEHIKNSSIKNE